MRDIQKLIDKLQTLFPLGRFSELGEQDKKKFISLYGAILKIRNILSAFDDLLGKRYFHHGIFKIIRVSI